ncbi:hypothetical protein GW17_00011591 [Ensete ventricosum]|nr:hypothetical protein GW17_00011591 [Ensete ventricosum]
MSDSGVANYLTFCPRFALPSDKTSYCLVHTGPVVHRYADRSLPCDIAKIDRRRLIDGEKWKKKKKRRRRRKKKEERRKKKEE